MDSVRHVIAVLFAITIPPALAYWFLLHPFVGFWRRLGPGRSWTLLGLFFVVTIGGCWLLRGAIVGRDLGTSIPLAIAGGFLYAVSAVIDVRARRHLKFHILAGLPEIRGIGNSSALLRSGIYARIRHPRYLAFTIALAGFALVANHLGLYIMALLALPVLWALIVVEERELRARFGDAYREYERTVPRLFPRLRSDS
ncbi:MAG: isoprenylcysteine carboxylmethyltransferase family protein [Gemmatimonadetes bacterium]|nr:isoprenylcysteine carboxylmethyltransferase family protein [Gemmatimonadota bacterium]